MNSFTIIINNESYLYDFSKDKRINNIFYKIYENYVNKKFIDDEQLSINYNDKPVKKETINKIFDFLYHEKLDYDKNNFFSKDIYYLTELFVTADLLLIDDLKSRIIGIIKYECQNNISYKKDIDFLMKMHFGRHNLHVHFSPTKMKKISDKTGLVNYLFPQNQCETDKINKESFIQEYKKYFLNINAIKSEKELTEYTTDDLFGANSKYLNRINETDIEKQFSDPMSFNDSINGIIYYFPYEFMNKHNVKETFESYARPPPECYNFGMKTPNIKLSNMDDTLCKVLFNISINNIFFADEILKYDTPYHVLKALYDYINLLVFDDEKLKEMTMDKVYSEEEYENENESESLLFCLDLDDVTKKAFKTKTLCKQYMFCDNLIPFELFLVFNDESLLKFVNIPNKKSYESLLNDYPDHKLIIENKKHDEYDTTYIQNGFDKLSNSFKKLTCFNMFVKK